MLRKQFCSIYYGSFSQHSYSIMIFFSSSKDNKGFNSFKIDTIIYCWPLSISLRLRFDRQLKILYSSTFPALLAEITDTSSNGFVKKNVPYFPMFFYTKESCSR